MDGDLSDVAQHAPIFVQSLPEWMVVEYKRAVGVMIAHKAQVELAGLMDDPISPKSYTIHLNFKLKTWNRAAASLQLCWTRYALFVHYYLARVSLCTKHNTLIHAMFA